MTPGHFMKKNGLAILRKYAIPHVLFDKFGAKESESVIRISGCNIQHMLMKMTLKSVIRPQMPPQCINSGKTVILRCHVRTV